MIGQTVLQAAGRKAGPQELHMAGHGIPHFHNDAGHARITVGAKEFMCVGANPPFDHPHVFLDMGDDNEKVCPYCSTLYVFDASLAFGETQPAGCTYPARAA